MLANSKVILRGPLATDMDYLLKIRNDVELQRRLMAHPQPNDEQRVREWLERRMNDPAAIFFIVATPPESRPVGFAQIVQIDKSSGSGILGICITEAQRTGLSSLALELLEDHAAARGIRKLRCEVLANNSEALKFFARNGFLRTKLLEDRYSIDAQVFDAIEMEKTLPAPVTD